MNIKEAIEFIQEADWKGSVLGLSRIQELLEILGNPHKKLKFIHVAGSNGKGSVSAMLASVLKEAGYKTGLCISPHLLKYNERMQVDGEDISDDDLCEVASVVKEALVKMEDVPTEFERVLAMCFLYFLKKNCDIVVLEVGLGGRIDGTNVIDPPVLSIITHIALEHTDILGNDLAKIAVEKGGIIKPGTAVVLYRQEEAVHKAIEDICRGINVPLIITDSESQKPVSADLYGQTFDYKGKKDIFLSLIGNYQYKNAAVVLDAVDVLRERGFDIPEKALREGLRKVKWPGRFEVLKREPLFIADGAHNPDGTDQLAASIRQYLPDKKILFVMSVMADKDYRYMLKTMAPFGAGFIAVAPDYYRALPPVELAKAIKEETGIEADVLDSVTDGVKKALSLSQEYDAIIAFGSLYQMGEVRECVL